MLGVVIDCKLNWKSHILSVRSKLSKCCAFIYRANSLINKHGMHILYYSLFMPYIMYCAEVWGNTYATNINNNNNNTATNNNNNYYYYYMLQILIV